MLELNSKEVHTHKIYSGGHAVERLNPERIKHSKCNQVFFISGAFQLYDLNHDGVVTRREMLDVVRAVYQMLVSMIMSD